MFFRKVFEFLLILTCCLNMASVEDLKAFQDVQKELAVLQGQVAAANSNNDQLFLIIMGIFVLCKLSLSSNQHNQPQKC